jgi:hypothetical protein
MKGRNTCMHAHRLQYLGASLHPSIYVDMLYEWTQTIRLKIKSRKLYRPTLYILLSCLLQFNATIIRSTPAVSNYKAMTSTRNQSRWLVNPHWQTVLKTGV